MTSSQRLQVSIPTGSGISLGDYERDVEAVLDVAAFSFALQSGDGDFRLRGIPADRLRVLSGGLGTPFEIVVDIPAAPESTATVRVTSSAVLCRLVGKAIALQSTPPEAEDDDDDSDADPPVRRVSPTAERIALIGRAIDELTSPYEQQLQQTLEQAQLDRADGRRTKATRVIASLHRLVERHAVLTTTVSADVPPKPHKAGRDSAGVDSAGRDSKKRAKKTAEKEKSGKAQKRRAQTNGPRTGHSTPPETPPEAVDGVEQGG